MMTAKLKLNTKRADACRPATSAPTKTKRPHRRERRGSDTGKPSAAATLHSPAPPHRHRPLVKYTETQRAPRQRLVAVFLMR